MFNFRLSKGSTVMNYSIKTYCSSLEKFYPQRSFKKEVSSWITLTIIQRMMQGQARESNIFPSKKQVFGIEVFGNISFGHIFSWIIGSVASSAVCQKAKFWREMFKNRHFIPELFYFRIFGKRSIINLQGLQQNWNVNMFF